MEKQSTGKEKKKKKKKRCAHECCKKKLKITDYPCKCKKIYCSLHRHDHVCTFDFQKEAREKLMKQNPSVVPLKIAVL